MDRVTAQIDGMTTSADGRTSTIDSATATGDGASTDAAAPRTDGSSAAALSWPGVYAAHGVWDLSGPITAERTLGTVVTDLLVDQIVSLAGIPSLLVDEGRDVVRDLVGTKVKSLVDQSVPAPLRPNSDLMRKLAV